jgi:hypothetical protein
MKKLKLAEGWADETSNAKPGTTTPSAKPSATQSTQPAVDFPSTISDPLDIANVKARAMKLAPDIESAGDPYIIALLVACIDNPWLLSIITTNPGTVQAGVGVVATAGSIILWKLGKKALRKMMGSKNQAINVPTAEIDTVFNAKWMGSRWKKTALFNLDMKYLIKGLRAKGSLTEDQYNILLGELKSGTLKFNIFKNPTELRKAVKDFAIYCMLNGKIRYNEFKSLAHHKFTPEEEMKLVQAKYKLANKLQLNLDVDKEEQRIIDAAKAKKAAAEAEAAAAAAAARKSKIRGGRRF